jgi:Leucine-rich repeat (LRR) protein
MLLLLWEEGEGGKGWIRFFPGSLTILDLSHNRISSLKAFKFPARLESLHLSRNQIFCLRGVQLSAQLTLLHVDANRMSDLEGFIFPACLRSLRVDEVLAPVVPRLMMQEVKYGAPTLDLKKHQQNQIGEGVFGGGGSAFRFEYLCKFVHVWWI